MNKALIIGNLTADPEVTTVGNENICKCSMRIAVKRRYANSGGERATDFFTVIAWRQLGSLCKVYLHKGSKCAVVGELQTRSYDAQDGTKRYVTEILADEVEFLTRGAQSGADAPSNGKQQGNDAFAPVDDDELSF